MSTAAVLAGRTFGHWRAQPFALAIELLFPVLIMLMMAGMFGGAIAGSAGDYIPFVVPGVLALSMLFGLESTMTAVNGDLREGITDRFRSLPISAGSVLFGRVLADLAGSVAVLITMSITGFLLGWRWEALAPALVAYLLLLWLRLALLWVGIYLGLAASGAETVTAIQILVWPVGFLSTAFLDPATMPPWLGAIAQWNPLSSTATAVRDLFGNPTVAGGTWAVDNADLLAVLWPAALLLVFVPLAVRRYRTLDR
ncbi:ABC transporter permease [Millisia brevis]|uniref:ABC transporter permease n=1 Tax=Millisia brevis TaxID=264148 RepID=UPI0008329EC5|nr:ABC transporter permease [Millisia brevis]